MSDELKLKRQRELGVRAKLLREDSLLNAIFEGLRANYMKEWAQSEPGDIALREEKWRALRALLDVRAELNSIYSNGEVAAKFLAEYERSAA